MFDHKVKSATHRQFLIFLGTNANKEGESWWTVENMASEFGTSSRTIQRWLTSLEEYGLITVFRYFKDGKQKTNIIRVGEASPNFMVGVTKMSPCTGCQKCHPDTSYLMNPRKDEPTKENQTEELRRVAPAIPTKGEENKPTGKVKVNPDPTPQIPLAPPPPPKDILELAKVYGFDIPIMWRVWREHHGGVYPTGSGKSFPGYVRQAAKLVDKHSGKKHRELLGRKSQWVMRNLDLQYQIDTLIDQHAKMYDMVSHSEEYEYEPSHEDWEASEALNQCA